MGIFGTIMGKIFHSADAKPADAPGGATPSAPTDVPAAPTELSVDVEEVLIRLAETKGGGGHWQTSIVDAEVT